MMRQVQYIGACKKLATVAIILSLTCQSIYEVNAIFNCLSPSPFAKMKGNIPSQAERANWYQQMPNFDYQQPMHPLKSLFQPKWKPSIFGSKMNAGWPSWKISGSGGGLFRPTNSYDGLFNQPQFGGGYASPPVHGYQLPDNLNIAPMILPHMPTNYASPPPIQQQHINEGWSQPATGYGGNSVVVQPSDSYYGSSTTSGAYSQPSADSPAIRPNQMGGTKNPASSQQQVIVDPYSQVLPAQQQPQSQPTSGTKNPSNSRPAQQQTSTRNNFFDYFGSSSSSSSSLFPSSNPWMSNISPNSFKEINDNELNESPQTYYIEQVSGDRYTNQGSKQQQAGYSYPEWYSGTINSPSKTIQQLKYNLRLQQQQALSNIKKSAILTNKSSGLFRRQVFPSSTLVLNAGEPRFDGFGIVETLNNREARLRCAFTDAIDQTDLQRPLWVKFTGSYNTTGQPPFNCQNNSCRSQEINTSKDYRYTFDNKQMSSTLIISQPRLDDYGVYRCSAISNSRIPLETVYQIIEFDTR